MYNLGVAYGEMLKFDTVSSCGGQVPFVSLPSVSVECRYACPFPPPSLSLPLTPLFFNYLVNWKFCELLISLALQAIVFYELAFHFNPHCAEACNNLGVIYKDQDNLDKAVECYQVWLRLSLVILLIFSFSYTNFYNFDIVDFLSFLCFSFQLALSIKPNFSQSLNNLGVVYTVQVLY